MVRVLPPALDMVTAVQTSKAMGAPASPALVAARSAMAADVVVATLDRIQHHVWSQRLRARDFFGDFDPLNTGFVSVPRFERGLARLMEKAPLRADEAEHVARFYLADDVERLTDDFALTPRINWEQFVADVDAVFQTDVIEGAIATTAAASEAMRRRRNEKLDAHLQDPSLRAVLRLLNGHLARAANDVGMYVAEFDPKRTGYISVAQFERAFLPFDVTPAQTQRLLTQYGRSDVAHPSLNFLHLKRDCLRVRLQDHAEAQHVADDVETERRRLQLPVSPRRVGLASRFQYDPAEAEVVVVKVAKHAQLGQLNMAFRNKDFTTHFSCGNQITQSQFQRLLSMMGFVLSQHELDLLSRRFATGHDQLDVDYTAFLKTIEEPVL
ncbi:hypothetical protein CXG81DRAFT_18533 [Caulochytrium protostelioides]|uniref:EF-hand domain-containing protein n=1 Tax=Caulochytrium protostelioides TaxID=1555241 RepID=A0A4P9X8W4_9FUNG|nr:hypothetical protein CXG81DRAFT_18533 [Caulochytrium protostelioides]|eukprot:RKP01715.1 hypothetical protein CXG81DRAFT_18533 [Caulochytrium protostelioides]